MELDYGTIISLITTVATIAISFGIMKGSMNEQIKTVAQNLCRLENKIDKMDNMSERLVVVEQSTKSAHKRIDDLCKQGDFERREKQ